MQLERFPDWPERLSSAIEARRQTPYAWGANDCCLYAADLIAATTGQDFGGMFRGTYSDQAGAQAMMQAHGWADLEALADAMLERRFDHPRRGDLVLYKGRDGDFFGIVWQGGIIGPAETRPIVWPMSGVLAVWSIG